MKYLFIVLALSFSSQAHAAITYCADLKKLQNRVTDCADNEYFSEAGVVCLQNLEKQITNATNALKKNLAQPKTSSAQGASFDSTVGNYSLSVAQIDALLIIARASAYESFKFYKSIVLPEDGDNPDVAGTGEDADKFMKQSECYSRADKVLSRVAKKFGDDILALERAKEVALANGGAAGISGQNIKADTLTGNQPAGGVGKSGTGPKGKPVKDSDISGTEKKKQP